VFSGHVKTVDTVASQQDFFASDVKVYKTIIKIDGHPEGLRPGMSAEVTIFADESGEDVLTVPVQSVIGTISMGAKRKVFVVGADGQPVQRDIVVGMTNERKVEVKEGLSEGERVVENPIPLLSEGSEMKAGKVRVRNDSDSEPSNGDGKKKQQPGKKDAPNGKGPATPGAGGPAGKGFGGGPPSPEQMQQMRQAILDEARNKTPAERREMINARPEQFRPLLLQLMRENKLEVAD
jgi:hypothetical protein